MGSVRQTLGVNGNVEGYDYKDAIPSDADALELLRAMNEMYPLGSNLGLPHQLLSGGAGGNIPRYYDAGFGGLDTFVSKYQPMVVNNSAMGQKESQSEGSEPQGPIDFYTKGFDKTHFGKELKEVASMFDLFDIELMMGGGNGTQIESITGNKEQPGVKTYLMDEVIASVFSMWSKGLQRGVGKGMMPNVYDGAKSWASQMEAAFNVLRGSANDTIWPSQPGTGIFILGDTTFQYYPDSLKIYNVDGKENIIS